MPSLRVELVLESRDPEIDQGVVAEAVAQVQRHVPGRATTVLHVVVPVGGDALVRVYELRDGNPNARESFVIPRGRTHWLLDALVADVRRRSVMGRAPGGSLLMSWDGSAGIETRGDLAGWCSGVREGAANLSAPPPR